MMPRGLNDYYADITKPTTIKLVGVTSERDLNDKELITEQVKYGITLPEITALKTTHT